MVTNWSEHLPYNPITDRYETGGDEIEFAEESDDLAGEYGAADECTCQRCRQARRKAAEDPRRKS